MSPPERGGGTSLNSVNAEDEHTYYQNWKLVRSGQVRTYYNAGCSCGWRMRKRNGDLWFRCSDEDAVSDWFEHAQGQSSTWTGIDDSP